MRVIDVYPKEIHVVFELDLPEVLKLQKVLSMVEIKYDSTIEDEREAAIYLTNGFYPFINEIVQKVTGKKDGA
jgi:hypothetical protein